MENVEVMLRLIEAASVLPAVRVATDPVAAAEAARTVAEVWYHKINEVRAKPTNSGKGAHSRRQG